MILTKMLYVNEIYVALSVMLFEWVMVMVEYGTLAGHVFDLCLNGAALVAVDIRVGTLLLHTLQVCSLGVLDDVLGVHLVMFQLLGHL